MEAEVLLSMPFSCCCAPWAQALRRGVRLGFIVRQGGAAAAASLQIATLGLRSSWMALRMCPFLCQGQHPAAGHKGTGKAPRLLRRPASQTGTVQLYTRHGHRNSSCHGHSAALAALCQSSQPASPPKAIKDTGKPLPRRCAMPCQKAASASEATTLRSQHCASGAEPGGSRPASTARSGGQHALWASAHAWKAGAPPTSWGKAPLPPHGATGPGRGPGAAAASHGSNKGHQKRRSAQDTDHLGYLQRSSKPLRAQILAAMRRAPRLGPQHCCGPSLLSSSCLPLRATWWQCR
jgi:hypothetical protein